MKNTLGKAFDKQTTTTAGLTPWQAVLGAVAGTIGMGNIAGTASAIAVGGPGAMFWMWIFAFLGMSIKMEEVTLALHYREVAPDGSSIYGGLKQIGKVYDGWKLGNTMEYTVVRGRVVMAHGVVDETASGWGEFVRPQL